MLHFGSASFRTFHGVARHVDMLTDWTCPDCGQKFVARHARHSCDVQTLDEFFEGLPSVRKLFEAVRTQVRRLGPVDVVATKSQVSFRARTRFAWVWLPS